MRLTNDMRAIIRDAAIRAAFDEKREAMASAEEALAIEAYNTIFSADIRSAVAALPSDWFRLDECLQFNIGGLRIHLKTTRGNGLAVPYKHNGHSGYSCNPEIGVIASGDLCERIKKHAVAKEGMEEARASAYRALDAQLSSIQTAAKLKSAWPEGAPYYARLLDATATSLPAIRFSEINARLGIAPTEAA